MSKILKGIKLTEAPSEYGANLDWAAGKASQDTNEPQKYAIEVGPNKYVGDIYTNWNQADAKRKELAKKYFQVKVVPISKMNEDMTEGSDYTPTDAKEKAESQGYKVIKVKDPSDSHYFNFKEGSVTSNFKIGPKSEYDKGKADSYYRRGDRSDQSSDPKEYLRGYDENDAYKDWGRDDPVDEGSSNILKGISRMVKGKPTPGTEYQKYFDAYKKAMQTGDKIAIANATRDLNRIEKVAGPAFFEGLGLPFPGTYEQERGLESTDEKLDEKWSDKYKRSIDCSHPKGFSQRAHCQGKKKK